MKAKTIDEHSGQAAGSFKKFVEQKEVFLQRLERERKERIRASRQAASDLSWAA